MKTNEKWLSETPPCCEICGKLFNSTDNFFYDFKTWNGSWGIGCETCFKENEGQLGSGCGQKYDLKTLEKIL
jgi:hypothetical protein